MRQNIPFWRDQCLNGSKKLFLPNDTSAEQNGSYRPFLEMDIAVAVCGHGPS
jgi:hypothetical protein